MSSLATIPSLRTLPDVQSLTGLNAKSFGARGDGTGDDTAAIQAALNAAQPGQRVTLPRGAYLCLGSLTVPPFVTLAGCQDDASEVVNHDDAPFNLNQILTRGTVLMIRDRANVANVNTAPGFLTLQTGAGVRGMGFYWPDQLPNTTTAYPFAIDMAGTDNTVANCYFVNAWCGIKSLTWGAYRQRIEHVRGQFAARGVVIDGCVDTPILTDVCFNPAWDVTGTFWQTCRNNGIAFEFMRVDQLYAKNCFAFASHIAFHMTASAQNWAGGNRGYGTLAGCGADGGDNCIVMDDCAGPGYLLTGFMGQAVGPNIATGAAFTGHLGVSNSSFWGPTPGVFSVQGTATSSVAIQGCKIDTGGGGVGVLMYGGSLLCTGNVFASGASANDVQLQAASGNGTVYKAVVTDNMALGRAFRLTNNAGAVLTAANNA